jgi:5-methyltetrahydrofolate--homocysteine methyltransferase
MINHLSTVLTFKDKTVEINFNLPTAIIGERINPTGRKKVMEALQAGNFEMICQDARDQLAAGAAILDVNAGVPGADEPVLLQQVLKAVMDTVEVPLSIDTANPKALEAALSIYPGKALVNSVNGEERSLAAILPLVKEHGAAVIGLCMDDDGIPETPEKRLAVAARIVERAGRLDIDPEDIVIDPLALSLGADSNGGKIALKTIELVVEAFGVNISMGASNISYGLPDRKYVNSAFIAMAIHAGLTCPITNPLVTEVSTAILAADLAMGRDEYAMRWIKAYRKREKEAAARSAQG